jgi:hypothetical protein
MEGVYIHESRDGKSHAKLNSSQQLRYVQHQLKRRFGPLHRLSHAIHDHFHAGPHQIMRAIRHLETMIPFLIESAIMMNDPRLERSALAIDIFIGDVERGGLPMGVAGPPMVPVPLGWQSQLLIA